MTPARPTPGMLFFRINIILALELTPAEVTLDYGEEVTLKIYASYPDIMSPKFRTGC